MSILDQLELASWEHELRNARGEWTVVHNTSGARKEISRQLDAQGADRMDPIRHIFGEVVGNRMIMHRDPETGHIDAGIRYDYDARRRTHSTHLSLNDVRVSKSAQRKGIGSRMLRELVKAHPDAKDMAVYNAVQSAKPWYAKNGAVFTNPYVALGEWSPGRMKALRSGKEVRPGAVAMEGQTDADRQKLYAELELGWHFNPLEKRDAHGQWTKNGADYTVPSHDRLIIPNPPKNTRFPYYRAPEDHPFFKAHPVSSKNVVASYDASSPQERAQGMRWYSDAHDVAQALATQNGGTLQMSAGVLASYSPQTGWPTNMLNASRAMKEHRALGPGDGMITGAMQRNAQKFLDGGEIDQTLKSPKIHAFAQLIANGGDHPTDTMGQVVIDRHAMSVAAGNRLSKDDIDGAPIGTGRYYQYVADAYRQAAAEINARGGEQVAPYQLQAITWLHQQAANQAQDDAGEGGGGKGASHGRRAAGMKAWERWNKYAGEQQIPTEEGTTALAGGIFDQVTDLGWEDAWLHEMRDPKGRWTRTPGGGGGATSDIPVAWGVKGGGEYPSDQDYASDLHKIAVNIRHRPDTARGKNGGHLLAAAIALGESHGDVARDQLAQAARAAKRNGASQDDIDQIHIWARAVSGAQNRAKVRNGENIGMDHETYPGEFGDQLLNFWRKETDPAAKQELNLASAENDGENAAGAAEHLREAARLASLTPDPGNRAFEYRKLAGRIVTTAENKTSSQAVVTGYLEKSAPIVPRLLGGGKENWNGKLILFPERYTWRGDTELAEMGWDGHMEMQQAVADEIKATLGDPDHQVKSLDAFTVPLHEMIHASIPEGETYDSHKQAYQDVGIADIEEGATELATIHHAGEYFDKMGVSDRQTALVAPGGVDNPAWSRANDQLTNGLQELENSLESDGRPPQLQAARHIQSLIDSASSVGVMDPDEAGDVLTEVERLGDPAAHATARDLHTQLHQMARIPMTLHSTLADLARQNSDPARVEAGNAWGHYPNQTRDFQQWVREIAGAEGHSNFVPGSAGYRRMVELSDEVNRQGSASKVRAMAGQVVRAMGGATMSADMQASLMASVQQSILAEWRSTDDAKGKEAYRRANRAARMAMENMAETTT